MVAVFAALLCHILAAIVVLFYHPPCNSGCYPLTPVIFKRGETSTSPAIAGSYGCAACLAKDHQSPVLKCVCLCVIMSSETSEYTASVLDGNWSTTAENRGIRCVTSERCQGECGLHMGFRHIDVFQCYARHILGITSPAQAGGCCALFYFQTINVID